MLCVACVYSAVNTTRSSLMKDLTFTTGSTVLYSSAVNTVARLAHFTHLLSSSVCYCRRQKFAVAGPHVWNSLPATIRQITNYRQFRQRWGAVVVICLQRGADLHMAQLMPLPLTVSCYSKIQIGFTFLVPAHLGSPGQRAVKRV